ncbi:hypothetical protein C8R44DRAFT_738999 [Mycena epipterygia]|nr:hypothetical protein C8R44DRAFT_738999 [Mycena epipterygia]
MIRSNPWGPRCATACAAKTSSGFDGGTMPVANFPMHAFYRSDSGKPDMAAISIPIHDMRRRPTRQKDNATIPAWGRQPHISMSSGQIRSQTTGCARHDGGVDLILVIQTISSWPAFVTHLLTSDPCQEFFYSAKLQASTFVRVLRLCPAIYLDDRIILKGRRISIESENSAFFSEVSHAGRTKTARPLGVPLRRLREIGESSCLFADSPDPEFRPALDVMWIERTPNRRCGFSIYISPTWDDLSVRSTAVVIFDRSNVPTFLPHTYAPLQTYYPMHATGIRTKIRIASESSAQCTSEEAIIHISLYNKVISARCFFAGISNYYLFLDSLQSSLWFPSPDQIYDPELPNVVYSMGIPDPKQLDAQLSYSVHNSILHQEVPKFNWGRVFSYHCNTQGIRGTSVIQNSPGADLTQERTSGSRIIRLILNSHTFSCSHVFILLSSRSIRPPPFPLWEMESIADSA